MENVILAATGMLLMLAKSRTLILNNNEVARTPLLLPSFSSKGFPDIAKILDATEEVIVGEILISAYDIYHEKILPKPELFPLVFLDSGGYEASAEKELSDISSSNHSPKEWNRERYTETIENWATTTPTVLVSYDHPEERLPLAQQVDRARQIFCSQDNVLKEFLVKPEVKDKAFLDMDAILNGINLFESFDIIGFTEKELGGSILERMKNITKIRKALNDAKIDKPVHIFGSLDTITTPLYFVAGADIFDGLTWLRFAYMDGHTVYKQNYGALHFDLNTEIDILNTHCWFNNYYYLKDLELEMRNFAKNGNFKSFKHHAYLIQNSFQQTINNLGA